MGYRSLVAYRIAFKNKEVLNEFIALVMLKGGYEKEALSECEIDVTDKECYVNFYQSDVKWYESYADVQAHTWLREFAVERFPDDSAWKFVRIGEENGDIEEEDGGDSDLFDSVSDGFYPITTIELPFSAEYTAIGDSLAVIET